MNAVQTNGIGQRTTAHLNLTRTLADAWGIEPEPHEPVAAPAPAIIPQLPVAVAFKPRKRRVRKFTKFRFAGYDPTERFSNRRAK